MIDLSFFECEEVDLEGEITNSTLKVRDQYFCDQPDIEANKVILGDNLSVMAALLPDFVGRFDFIYFDPPFRTGRDFGKSIRLRGEPAVLLSADAPEFRDTWAEADYCRFVLERLRLARRLLAPTGAVIIHCDFNAQHLIRLIADHLFGAAAFRNQIIWKFRAAGAQPRDYASSHDMLLWYTRSDIWTFRLPPAADDPIGAAGGDGITDVWDDTAIQKNWADIDEADCWSTPSPGASARRAGERESIDEYVYPTQKPLAFLMRLLSRHTRPGDLLLDVFGGSGSLAVAALAGRRRFVSIDVNPRSVYVTSRRLLRWMDRNDRRATTLPALEVLSLDRRASDGPLGHGEHDCENGAALDMTVVDGVLAIRAFRPPPLLNRLGGISAGDAGWRRLVDGVLIDWHAQSGIFRPTVLDLPAHPDLVSGAYRIPEGAGKVRVRLHDVAGAAWEQRFDLAE